VWSYGPCSPGAAQKAHRAELFHSQRKDQPFNAAFVDDATKRHINHGVTGADTEPAFILLIDLD